MFEIDEQSERRQDKMLCKSLRCRKYATHRGLMPFNEIMNAIIYRLQMPSNFQLLETGKYLHYFRFAQFFIFIFLIECGIAQNYSEKLLENVKSSVFNLLQILFCIEISTEREKMALLFCFTVINN